MIYDAIDRMSEEDVKQLKSEVHELFKRQNSTANRLWDLLTRAVVCLSIALAGWVWTIDRMVAHNGFRLNVAEKNLDNLPSPYVIETLKDLQEGQSKLLESVVRLEEQMRTRTER